MTDMVFCWGCGKEIHKSAAICPHCGADQKRTSRNKYSKYTDVPWYRKNWFAILSGLMFCPILFFIALTGNIYYVRKGEVRSYSTLARVFLVVLTFVPALILILILGGFGLSGMADLADRNNSAALVELEKAQISDLRPDGDLAEIFALGSSYTDIQRENKLKEIQGKVVNWRLPVYEISKTRGGYRVQTQSSMRLGPIGQNVVGTFIDITPRSDDERRVIEALKTNDLIAFKGKIADVTLRHINVKPAVLAITSPPIAQGANAAPVAADDASLFLADCADWLKRDGVQFQSMTPREAEDFAKETCQAQVVAFKACIQSNRSALQCASEGWEKSEDGESDESLRWLRLKQKVNSASK